MRELVRTAAEVFARDGLGAMGLLISGQVDNKGRSIIAEITSPHGEGQAIRQPLEASISASLRGIPAELQQKLFFSPSLANTTSQIMGLAAGLSRHPWWTDGSGWNTSVTRDAVGLICHDGPLNVAMLAIGLPKATTLKAGERRLGGRIATHVGAALRLRRSALKNLEGADAILSPSGRLDSLAHDHDGPALKEGFDRRRYARRRGVAAEAALEVWQGLHDGRWSLIDYVDTDGKAFVLAVRNEPARDVASSLTDRQRATVALATLGYGNKQIGYALGLTATAVAMLLRRARAATGLTTRAALVRAFKRNLAGRDTVQ
jgi:DNA-binding CsgD family transcriptional regulator